MDEQQENEYEDPDYLMMQESNETILDIPIAKFLEEYNKLTGNFNNDLNKEGKNNSDSTSSNSTERNSP
jgi:hypothetical protein